MSGCQLQLCGNKKLFFWDFVGFAVCVLFAFLIAVHMQCSEGHPPLPIIGCPKFKNISAICMLLRKKLLTNSENPASNLPLKGACSEFPKASCDF